MLTQPDSKPASIIFELKQTPHASFEVRGIDLLATVRITLLEALQGFSRSVLTHLDGRRLHLTKARGDVVRPGQVDVVHGEGMMDQRRSERRGDLFLRYEIEFPTDEWARNADEAALSTLLPPKRTDLPAEEDVVTDDLTTKPGDINKVRRLSNAVRHEPRHAHARSGYLRPARRRSQHPVRPAVILHFSTRRMH